ncbi:uncharacterized protein LOC131005587 isoform X1 [Salvia miltiorrhiza]|uniref:uncharacterized protein LOC131005587 isoform X1 n=1 Tax=Salvia miltiorrhiza TaxID=226208 RepID=UPI0025ABBD51|nr:uncharacterized protein LOC131005587 isoform X1 [Salvia miltiorrhiza]
MAPLPGLYSGKSSLGLVARVSAFSFGVVYGSLKLKVLKVLCRFSPFKFVLISFVSR